MNGPFLPILPLRLPLRDAESARRQNILSWAMGMDSRTRDSGGRKESDAARFGEYAINCAQILRARDALSKLDERKR